MSAKDDDEFKLVKAPNEKIVYTDQQIEELAKCMHPKTGPIYFMENFMYVQSTTQGRVKFKPYPFQYELIDSYHNYRYEISLVSRQMGKALSLETPILTSTGFKLLKEIKVGDQIFGPDGNLTTVTFITDTMFNHKCFSVVFESGEEIIADEEHLWNYVVNGKHEEQGQTSDILNLIDSGNIVTIASTKPLELVDTEFEEDLNYLDISIEERKLLLDGIIEKYGSSVGGSIKIHVDDLLLRHQIIVLTASLGIITYQDEDDASLIIKSINHEENTHKIVKINEVESVPVRCLQVDNESHLFLAGHNLIPTHNTTCAAGYLLWYAMFVPDSTILVAAHKYTGTQEIMERVRYVYENCPDHIRAGVVTYNKQSLKFDNGSRIIAQTTTANTGRGMSLSLVYCLGGETSVTVRDKETGEVKDISLQDLYLELEEEQTQESDDIYFLITNNKDLT